MNANNSCSPKKGSLSFNDSPVEKSIISQMPLPGDSADLIDKVQLLNAEINRLNSELHY